jgi:hypothetical protein
MSAMDVNCWNNTVPKKLQSNRKKSFHETPISCEDETILGCKHHNHVVKHSSRKHVVCESSWYGENSIEKRKRKKKKTIFYKTGVGHR